MKKEQYNKINAQSENTSIITIGYKNDPLTLKKDYATTEKLE